MCKGINEAAVHGINGLSKHNWNSFCLLLQSCNNGRAIAHDHVRCLTDQLGSVPARTLCLALRKKDIEADVPPLHPAQVLKPLSECPDASLTLRIVRDPDQYTDTLDRPGLLSMRRKRPRSGRATNKGEELTSSHFRRPTLGSRYCNCLTHDFTKGWN